MNKLLEAYSKRLKVSESVYAQAHDGAKLSERSKLTVAAILRNTNNAFAAMNESFIGTTPTQRDAMGDYKKFCLC